jgi:hypothetical protein
MKCEDFMDSAAILKGPLQHRSISKEGNHLHWRKMELLHLKKLGILSYKICLDDSEFQEVGYLKKTAS